MWGSSFDTMISSQSFDFYLLTPRALFIHFSSSNLEHEIVDVLSLAVWTLNWKLDWLMTSFILLTSFKLKFWTLQTQRSESSWRNNNYWPAVYVNGGPSLRTQIALCVYSHCEKFYTFLVKRNFFLFEIFTRRRRIKSHSFYSKCVLFC